MAPTSPARASTTPKAATPATPVKRPARAKPAKAGAAPAKPAAQPAPQAKVPKAAAPSATAPSASSKPAKEKKVKVVRDSFTLPKSELLQITDMKKRAMALGIEVKKSELIRAGLQALSSMPDPSFKKALGNVPTIKTGRPAKA